MTPELVGFASFAFTAGALTFFAPCAYPLLPGYVAYFLGRGEGEHGGGGDDVGDAVGGDGTGGGAGASPWRAAVVGLHVVTGFALVYVALGGIVALAGSRALADLVLLELVVGSGMVVLGAGMALGYRVVPAAAVRFPARRRTAPGFVLFGVAYAAAAAGCSAPVFLGVVAAAAGSGPVAAAVGLGSYAAGMGSLLVAVTVLTALGRTAVLDRLPSPDRLARVAGVLLVLAGLAQLWLFVFRYDGLSRLGVA